MAACIKTLHTHHVAHRDIKLDNILITKIEAGGLVEVKLGDLGFSELVTEHSKMSKRVGTLGYIAPEILLKEPYNLSCDIFSLGCLSYALCGGQLPFEHQC